MGKLGEAALVAGVIVVVAGWLAKGWWERESERAENIRRAESAEQVAIRMSAKFDKGCPPDYVLITTTNGASRTLKSVPFHLAIYPDGSSKDVNSTGYSESTWTHVVVPGESISKCWPVRELQKVRYFLKIEREPSINPAVFYSPTEFIPRALPTQTSSAQSTKVGFPDGVK